MNTSQTDTLKEVSCRVTNSVLKYLESQGYDSDVVVDGLPEPYSKNYLSNSLNWVTYEIREIICRRAAALTQDDAVMYKVGLMTPVLNPLGGLEAIIGKLAGPTMAYRFVPRYSRLFDRVFKFKTNITGKNSATITMVTEQPQYKPSKDSCYYAQGILAAIPTLWGLPPAEITEIKCMHAPEPGNERNDVAYNAEACVYDVKWQPLSLWRQRLRDNILGKLIPVKTDFKELEQSLRLIDQRNTELSNRNKQLAAVREIAISVDRVKTIDEALSLAVEQAREIDGIRFVLVQTLDETGEYITTPYYSKKRRGNVVNAIKALGFDPDKELGKNPTSNKLRFPVSKVKIASDYINNPRVVTFTSLADLLDGVLPGTLCNAIQSILRVRTLVMVPLMVENNLWGSILFFLTKDIPVDILEMIGTHCGLALHNIINVNNLVSRNAELTARNNQLAAVREIAIGIDRVRTIQEALELTVEQAREIEGVRMVLVQKMDDAHENVITPYYSTVRGETRKIADAIKLVGLDLGKVLGPNPNSNRLRLPLSKLKVALEYNKRPRVMVIPTLAELLDGVWPPVLCNSIQKIGGIKKCVIVPLMVEGESWGHILYLLSGEVPVDILEMIGGHCAQAIKNIITLNNLEARNDELSALNRIANITSKSLDMETLLNNTLMEIADIFRARAVSVYLADKPGQPLMLAAQYGMVEERARELTAIGLDEAPMGKFFTSTENIITGGVEDFVDNIPKFKDAIMKSGPSRYMTSILHFGSVRYGLITVLREGAREFGEDEKSLLLSISNQLAVSLENSVLHRDVLKRAEEAEIARANLEELFRKHELTEEKLRESEERYRTIFQSANDILVLFDNKAHILDINSKVKEIGGYEPEEIIGKDFRMLTAIMTNKSIVSLARNFVKLKAGRNIPFFDVEMITKEGNVKTIQINAVAIKKEGRIIGGLAGLRDVTEIKQAEKNLKSQKTLIDRILATIPNAVLLLDKELKVIMANQAFYTLFNLKKNQVERKYVNRIFELPDFNINLEEALKGKAKETSREVRYSTGVSEKILLTNIFSMRDENLLVVINDVTEEREKQERLYLTDRLASVGEMASGVAHELNNPLTSIMGLAGLLITKETPENVREDLQAINAEAQRCAAIVKNLLTFARKHTLNKEPVQLTSVVKDVLKLRSYEHKANNIAVEMEFPPDLPKVLADYYQMQQVFLNIIINAEAAMYDAHKQGKLVISGKATDGRVSVSFTDDGPGIKKEHVGLIFNPFFTTKEVGKGTGLGLSIVYGIITSHGGKVSAASEPGKGATFIVELPAIGN